jgi:energy-coupling factor transporter ATP-binding protein EcfA2
MSLAAIRKKAKLKPPIMVLYGPGGIGKTTFAASMGNTIIVQSEDGIGKIECDHFPVAKDWNSFINNLNELLTEDHEYKVVCIDSLDWCETLLWEHVCEENGWAQIDTPAYGKGYVAALNGWKEYVEILNRLRDEKGMSVLQIAHNQIKRYEDPSQEPHDRHEIKLHRKAADLIVEHSDAVFFCNYKLGTVQVKGKGGGMTTKTIAGDRKIFTEQAPGYLAKNRYGLPSEMPMDWQAIREEMIK